MSSVPIHSPFADSILAALQHQGRSNDCAPFTVATVLNALLELNLDGRQLGRMMDRPRWSAHGLVVRRVPGWATFPWGMVDVMREYGLEACWRLFARTECLYRGLVQGLILMPVIASWKPLWAHVMLLIAWHPKRGWGFANTQFIHRDIFWMSNSAFQKHWRAMVHLLVEAKKGRESIHA